MTKLNYAQQIKHPEWQRKRLEVLEAHRFMCENCGATDEELHVHHPFYKRGAMIWQYDVDELRCLCHKCHKDEHAIDEKIKLEMSYGQHNKTQLLGWLKGNNLNPYTTVDDIEEATGILSALGINSRRLEEVLCTHGTEFANWNLSDFSYVVSRFIDNNLEALIALSKVEKQERLDRYRSAKND